MSRPALVQRLGRPFGVALLTASLLGQVQATTFSTLTLVQQAKKADVIVQAVIGTPSTVTEGGQSYAVYPLKVSETLAGDASQLPQVGGGPALYVLSGMDQAPVFQAGQEAVLLLYKGRLDSPLVGFNQGAYLISSGQVSVLPVAGAPLPQPQGQPEGPQGGAASGGTVQPGSGPAAAPTTPPATAPSGTTPSGTTPPGGTVTPPQPPAGTSTPPGAPQTGNGIGAPDTTGGAGSTGGSQPVATPPTPPRGLPPAQGTPPSTTPEATVPPVPAVTPPAPSGTVPAATGTTPPVGSAAPTTPAAPGTTPAAPGTTPSVSPTTPAPAVTPAAPTAAPTPAATPAPPPGVLGNIKTAAQLKAAIVAARAAK